jgi:hypothetical protein
MGFRGAAGRIESERIYDKRFGGCRNFTPIAETRDPRSPRNSDRRRKPERIHGTHDDIKAQSDEAIAKLMETTNLTSMSST